MVKKKVSKEDRKFIKDFIRLYLEKKELELLLSEENNDVQLKEKIRKVSVMLNKLLPNYSILFDNDMKILYKIFNEVIEKENISFFNQKFDFFLKGVFEELHNQKIIDKKTFNELSKFLTKFNLEHPSIGPYALGGVGAI